MTAYESLAGAYDGLTVDVPYPRILDFIEAVLRTLGREPKTVLDLACGTGSMSVLLAERGYRVLGADISEEMLTVAQRNCAPLGDKAPYFIHQSMQRLRLPQPVELVLCLLDSLNYLKRTEDCRKTLHRVFDALTPGGVFFFDINTPTKLRAMNGQVSLDENDESYCVWRAEYDENTRLCTYGIDLFRREGRLWSRSFELHEEYAYEPEMLVEWLHEAGFGRVLRFGDCRLCEPEVEEQRIYFAAIKEA